MPCPYSRNHQFQNVHLKCDSLFQSITVQFHTSNIWATTVNNNCMLVQTYSHKEYILKYKCSLVQLV